jgi:hypothetical protein
MKTRSTPFSAGATSRRPAWWARGLKQGASGSGAWFDDPRQSQDSQCPSRRPGDIRPCSARLCRARDAGLSAARGRTRATTRLTY